MIIKYVQFILMIFFIIQGFAATCSDRKLEDEAIEKGLSYESKSLTENMHKATINICYSNGSN